MGYPAANLKIVLGGSIAADEWRTGVDFAVDSLSAPGNAQLDSLITNSILPRATTWWNVVKAYNSAGTALVTVGAYFYPAGASVATASQVRTITPVPGTGAFGPMPARTALVVSKRTTFSGRANRGRMYVPATNLNINASTMQVDAAACTAIVNATATMLSGWNADDWSPYALAFQGACVTSNSATSPPHEIVQLLCNTLPDSQRRRTNADLPTATSVANVT